MFLAVVNPWLTLFQDSTTSTLVCPMEISMELEDAFESSSVRHQFAVGVIQGQYDSVHTLCLTLFQPDTWLP